MSDELICFMRLSVRTAPPFERSSKDDSRLTPFTYLDHPTPLQVFQETSSSPVSRDPIRPGSVPTFLLHSLILFDPPFSVLDRLSHLLDRQTPLFPRPPTSRLDPFASSTTSFRRLVFFFAPPPLPSLYDPARLEEDHPRISLAPHSEDPHEEAHLEMAERTSHPPGRSSVRGRGRASDLLFGARRSSDEGESEPILRRTRMRRIGRRRRNVVDVCLARRFAGDDPGEAA